MIICEQKYNQVMKKKIQNYAFREQLGSGSYSKVYRAVNTNNNQEVAIKMVRADKIRENPKLEQGLVNQIHILTHMQPSAHIIRYFDMLKTTNNFYFIYEYCNGGTLEKLLRRTGPMPERQTLCYFRQIISAFKVLIENNIMHRDLKPDNIFLHNGVLKLGDFGFCKHLTSAEELSYTMLGSPIYMAPEVLNGEVYTNKADIWSLGVILYRMLYGKCPFEAGNIGKLLQMQKEVEIDIPYEPRVSRLVEQLMFGMLTKNQKQRLDWKEIFKYDINIQGEIFYIGKKDKMGSSSNSYSSNGVLYSSLNAQDVSNPFEKSKFPGSNQTKTESNIRQNLMERSTEVRAFHDRSPGHSGGRLKIDQHIKNHNKLSQINHMATSLARYNVLQGFALSYVLEKYLERDLGSLLRSVFKEIKGNPHMPQDKQEIYKEVKLAVEQEVELAKNCVQVLTHEIEAMGGQDMMNQLERNKLKTLKEFINGLSLESLDELILLSQLIDYLEENVLIQRTTYEKMSKEHLSKQIRSKYSRALY